MWRFVIIAIWAGSACGYQKSDDENCPFYRFQCKSGDCLDILKYCDGIADCPDGSDEIIDEAGCINLSNNVSRSCKLPSMYQCDGIEHCTNRSDETGCTPEYKMMCDRWGNCFNKLFLDCSGQPDWNCSSKVRCRGSVCTRYQYRNNSPHSRGEIIDVSGECGTIPTFRCENGKCLTSEKFCNGIDDCGDGSDEITANILGASSGMPCNSKWNDVPLTCILPEIHVCDRIDHCQDRVDECTPNCTDYSFFCKNGKCLPKYPALCDGVDDCGDMSDELEEECGFHQFQCSDKMLLSKDKFCDGRIDCEDGSDEIEATNQTESVSCRSSKSPNYKTCILPGVNACDKVFHCLNKEDEINCDDSDIFTCNNGKNIVKSNLVCNGQDDCGDSSDECNTTQECKYTFKCDNGKCIALSRFCDGIDDCGDNSDELIDDESGCSNAHADLSERRCKLPEKYYCDGVDHCSKREDECGGKCDKSFYCGSGKCMDKDIFCNGAPDCDDGSDELTSVVGLKCRSRAKLSYPRCVVPQTLLFENVTYCDDESDGCKGGDCFRCLTVTEKFYISKEQVCDGIIDCPDLSDECLCTPLLQPASQICQGYHSTCTNESREICCDNGTKCVRPEEVCDGHHQCSDKSDEQACGKKEGDGIQDIPYNYKCYGYDEASAIRCDGIPQCELAEDECGTFSKKDNREFELSCGNGSLDICHAMFKKDIRGSIACPEATSIKLNGKLCDGHEDCNKTQGELISIDERGCKNRLKCSRSRPVDLQLVTIATSMLCDGITNCEDEEDEDEDLCREKDPNRFYCENRSDGLTPTKHGALFVARNQVLDGKKDCWDNSDECPKDQFAGNPFSSSKRMIKNVLLTVMIWVMVILSTVGNTFVFWHTIKKLRQRGSKAHYMKRNYIVVMNLALADFLMGIYLFALAIENSITSGSYCTYDSEWRSSSYCTGLGTLAMISIQSSVGFLLLLTTYRAKSVLQPLKWDQGNTKFTFGLIALIWTVSIIMSVIPTQGYLEDYFVSKVEISERVPFFTGKVLNKTEIADFVTKLKCFFEQKSALRGDLSWSEIREALSTDYPKDWPQFEIRHQFGYYSDHAVCLPTIFTQTSDPSWKFSFVFICLLFLSFVFVLVAYVLVYSDATKHKRDMGYRDSSKEDKVLQARITRLILTNFACVVPVCIISILSIAGVDIDKVAYAISAIVLLPINSALNPLIYSNISDVIYRWLQPAVSSCISEIANKGSSHLASRRRATNTSLGTTVNFTSIRGSKTSGRLSPTSQRDTLLCAEQSPVHTTTTTTTTEDSILR